MPVSTSNALKYIYLGVGLHVRASFAGLTVWEGFVNQIDISFGRSSMTVGPLMDVVNKARTTLSLQTFGGTAAGGTIITDFASDEAAQAGFFILEGDIAGGTLVSATEGEEVRDLYLSEYSRPKINGNFDPTGSEPIITFSCEGYYKFFERYYYLRAVDNYIEATEKLKDVVDAEPNGLFSSDNGYFEEMGVSVNEYEDWSKTGTDIITDISSLGSSDDERILFGVYENRWIEYRAVSVGIVYEMEHSTSGSILSIGGGGAYIHPSLVRPGNWVRNKSISTPKRGVDDEGLVLVESVTFNAPNDLSINGGAFDTFTQRLARFNHYTF
jgi:hypothetical protein